MSPPSPGPTIIEGTLVEERPTVPKQDRRRLKTWQWAVVAAVGSLMLCCVGVPATWLGWPVVRDTIRGSAGSGTPTAALEAFVGTFGDTTHDGQMFAARTVEPSEKSTVLGQRRAFLDAKASDERKHPEVLSGRLDTGTPPDGAPAEYETAHGDTAEVLRYYRVSFGLAQPQVGVESLESTALPWRATVERDWDGWRLVSVQMPSWCNTAPSGEDANGYAGCR